jgi:hypothetical protein
MWWRAVLIIVGVPAITVMSAVGRPALAATVHNWQIVSRSSPSVISDENQVIVTVHCPDGTQRLGAGADVTGAGRDTVVIDEIVPGERDVSARAFETGYGTKEPWVLRAWAVCGNMGTTVQTMSKTSDDNADDYKEATASCPSPMVVIGTGFDMSGALGGALVHTVTPTKDSVTVKGYEVDHSFTNPRSWSVTAYAICAEDPDGDRIQVSHTTFEAHPGDSLDRKLGAVNCPFPKKPLGGGFALNGFQGRLNINNFVPFPAGVWTLASELPSIHTTNDWSITTHAICMPADLP